MVYMKALDKTMARRLHYVSSLTPVFKCTERCYLIVDEADCVMLKDLESFAKLAKS